MKYNYPIKYAAMPIIEQVGWSHGLNELERKYDIVCYIVSKCYLISSKTIYKENGKSEIKYEVTFPYINFERTTPSKDMYSVDEIFNTYEEALEDANKKNKKLCENTWVYLPCTEDLDSQIVKKIQEFNDKLSKYKMLEEQIIINTSDLEQSKVKELDNVILNRNGKFNILLSNLYEYLKLSTYSNFIVYSVSKDEYDKVVELIGDDTLNNSPVFENATPILYHKAKDENILVINKDGEVLYYISEWENLINNDDKKILPIDLKDIGAKIEIIFTTEKLEDILLSYNVSKYINLDLNQCYDLKRTRK